MKLNDLILLIILAAIWGASFLFTRIAVGDFSPIPLIEIRLAVGAACLLPLIAINRRGLTQVRSHLSAIVILGLLHSAIPFALLAYATLSMPAGVTSVLNATTPLFGSLVGAIWFKQRPPMQRIVGLAIGFGGVAALVAERATFGGGVSLLAVAAALCATLLYGIAANYAKARLHDVNPRVVASVSLGAAALATLPLAIIQWPQTPPPESSWLAAMFLAVFCTGVAYVIYYRLIANIGPTRAMAVTFLVPVFGLLWGTIFLGEELSGGMVTACGIILFGTALATGLIPARRRS